MTYDRLRRHGLFNAKVPRFTSYPPANCFDPQVSGQTATEWLAQVPDDAGLSLYVHIPFCRRLCWFCACRTQGTKTDVPLARYVDALIEEIEIVRRALPARIRVARLHLGGGTPTILPPDLMDHLLRGLDGAFGIAGHDEFSVEIDPLEIDCDRLAILTEHGLNRASLGVQDFDARVQEAIGRPQTISDTRDAVDMLRDRGIEDINFDLLYGLPFQTQSSLDETIDQVLEIAPSRLALYGYAHVPWMSKRQMMIPVEALPDPEARFGLFDHARKRLLGQGYLQVGIDHFARPDDGLAVALRERRLARNFQGYTEDGLNWLIGLGASAISRFPQGYVQNQPATALYQMAVGKGDLAVARGIALRPHDHLRAAAIQELMCYNSVRISALPDVRFDAGGWLAALVARYPDALCFDGTTLRVEPWARPLVRIFAAALGETEATEQGFSAAI
ncbi:MAG: oxygen-independent coproporphyrinogen III oxidase [Pseudomonadota bacterium]